MTVKSESHTTSVVSNNLLDIPLENGAHIEVEIDIVLNNVEVQPPRPKPKARLISFATHDLGFGQTMVVRVDQFDPPPVT